MEMGSDKLTEITNIKEKCSDINKQISILSNDKHEYNNLIKCHKKLVIGGAIALLFGTPLIYLGIKFLLAGKYVSVVYMYIAGFLTTQIALPLLDIKYYGDAIAKVDLELEKLNAELKAEEEAFENLVSKKENNDYKVSSSTNYLVSNDIKYSEDSMQIDEDVVINEKVKKIEFK